MSNQQYTREDTLKFFNNDELATDTYLKKYALTNKSGEIEEYLPSQMWRRMAHAAAQVEKDPEYWEKEFYRILEDWKAVPQGSIMFALGNKHQRSSLSNCFVLPMSDSIEGIFDCAKEMARTYSYRGGVGVDISCLRPEGALVTNAARTSTGAWSFMDFYSYVTRLIGQHGRRGALMITINDTHPDLIKFINAKSDKTKVTGANVSVKISDAFMRAVENDEIWKLSFKTKHELVEHEMPAREIWDILITNATETAEPGVLFWDNILNESPGNCYAEDGFGDVSTNPCVTSDTQILTSKGIKHVSELIGRPFFAVVNGHEYPSTSEGFFFTGYKQVYKIQTGAAHLKCTGNHLIKCYVEKQIKWIRADELQKGDKLIFNNPTGAFSEEFLAPVTEITQLDNELVYDCKIPAVSQFDANGILVHNCSEIPLPNYDACTLLSKNLTKYTRNDFTKSAKFDFNEYKKDLKSAVRFLDNVKEIDLKLMPLKEQREIAAKGRRIGIGIHGLADCLANLCLKYDSDEAIEFVTNLFEFQAKAVYETSVELAKEKGAFPVFNAEKEKNNPFLKRIGFAGIPRRNIACLTCAPTGTVSLICQTSSGIEPVFRNFYMRRRKITHNESLSVPKHQLTKDKLGDLWQTYEVAHHNVQRYISKMKLESENISDLKLPDYFVCSDQLEWVKRVEIQGAIQRFVDHSLSSTQNLPAGTSKEVVKEVYMAAWKKKCKGFTVYVDGCRDGVLITKEEQTKIVKTDAPKRPNTLPCDVYHIKVKGEDFFVLVGLLDGEPYEIFSGRNGKIADVKHGEIIKLKRGHYRIKFEDGSELENVNDLITEDQAAIARLASLSLRHGADIKHVVQTLEKVPGDMTSLARSMSRALKKYIPEGTTVSGASCASCSGNNLCRSEGCIKCLDCGWSGCN